VSNKKGKLGLAKKLRQLPKFDPFRNGYSRASTKGHSRDLDRSLQKTSQQYNCRSLACTGSCLNKEKLS
jgi:hypothetical protein